MGIVTDITFIVLAALIGGWVAHLLKQPLIIGYIFAGIVVGPHTAGPTVEKIHDIEMLAEIGVALLLFALGLEFSFGELRRLAKITFIGAPIQILACIGAAALVAIGIGISSSDALWIGAAISLSSTMVVIKTLASNDALESPAGRMMLALLIAQDLAVVPLILIVPQIAGEQSDYWQIVWAAAKSAIFLVGMFLAGTRVFPWIFTHISRYAPRELFFVATLGVALGAGFVSHQLGLSFALGAFIAGMLLSETDFNHQALSDVSSMRDLFGLIFFVSVGMLFNPEYFVEHLGLVLSLALAFVLIKAGIFALIVRAFRYEWGTAILVGLGLSQIGEFAFVIANAGNRSGQLSKDSYSLALALAVVSMVLTPALYQVGLYLAKRMRASAPETSAEPAGISDHVVIVGGGVVGSFIARVLTNLGRQYLVIESDHRAVMRMRDRGVQVTFGDASRRAILDACSISSACLVVVTVTNDALLPELIREVRALNRDVPIVVRVSELDDAKSIPMKDVHEIVHPQLEVGLEMVRQSLLALGSRDEEIFTLLSQLRSERYDPEGRSTGIDEKRLRAARLLDFRWYEVGSSSSIRGDSLRNLALRDRFGISVVAVIRGDEFTPNPGADFVPQEGDSVGVLGTEKQLSSFRLGMESV